MSNIGERKEDHLDLCLTDEVAFHQTKTLLAEVQLVHDPLPDLSVDSVDVSATVLGKKLSAPLLISAMTGGTERTGKINRDLAEVAEALGIGMGLGSQRPMLKKGDTEQTYALRSQAPTALIIGNIGLWQARELPTKEVEQLARRVGADALAIHLNVAQELVQPEGDRDFRDGLATLSRLTAEMELPVVVKETGCGISPKAARKLQEAGVCHLDVAGAGGTSWVAVEMGRAKGQRAALGEVFREWGVPTAASLALCAPLELSTLIGSGGIQNGLDAARALALGATAVGIARPVLQAYHRGGKEGARQLLADVIAGLRAALVLTGSGDLEALRRAPRVLRAPLLQWITQLGDDEQ